MFVCWFVYLFVGLFGVTAGGMGPDGSYLHDIEWTWDQGQGNNRLWIGRAEAGVFIYPRGDGPDWENPDYSKDYPTLLVTTLSPLPLPRTMLKTIQLCY